MAKLIQINGHVVQPQKVVAVELGKAPQNFTFGEVDYARMFRDLPKSFNFREVWMVVSTPNSEWKNRTAVIDVDSGDVERWGEEDAPRLGLEYFGKCLLPEKVFMRAEEHHATDQPSQIDRLDSRVRRLQDLGYQFQNWNVHARDWTRYLAYMQTCGNATVRFTTTSYTRPVELSPLIKQGLQFKLEK